LQRSAQHRATFKPHAAFYKNPFQGKTLISFTS
jgi:hypothetical protein